MNKVYTVWRSWRRIGLALVLILGLLMAMMPATVQAAPVTSDAAAVEESYSGHYYYVRYGDTLYKIGRRFGVSWRAIARANGLYYPYWIYAGQRLYIPTGGGYPGYCTSYYTVRYGDTLAQNCAPLWDQHLAVSASQRHHQYEQHLCGPTALYSGWLSWSWLSVLYGTPG